MLATGVTTCLPTLITAPGDVLARRFAALDSAVARSRLGPSWCRGTISKGPSSIRPTAMPDVIRRRR